MSSVREKLGFFSSETEQSLVASLFLYIKKNTFIPSFLEQLETQPDIQQQADLDVLQIAINRGDPHANIFKHPDCHLYVLHLITKKMDFWQGINIYFYLMILMQFTDKQALRTGDEHLKFAEYCPQNFPTVESLVDDETGEISTMGVNYFKEIIKHFKLLGIMINTKDLAAFVHQLPRSDRWLYLLPFHDGEWSSNNCDSIFYRDYCYLMTWLTEKISPHFIIYHSHSSTDYLHNICYVPSIRLLNYFLSKLPNPMQCQPMLGSVGPATLRNMHRARKHPFPLYSPHVKSNTNGADDMICGAVAATLHDAAHLFWGSLLTPTEYNFLFKHYIPEWEWLQKSASHLNRPNIVNMLEIIIDHLSDLDLLPHSFLTTRKRLLYYINKYGLNKCEQEFVKLKNDDRVMTLLLMRTLLWKVEGYPADALLWDKIVVLLEPYAEMMEIGFMQELPAFDVRLEMGLSRGCLERVAEDEVQSKGFLFKVGE